MKIIHYTTQDSRRWEFIPDPRRTNQNVSVVNDHGIGMIIHYFRHLQAQQKLFQSNNRFRHQDVNGEVYCSHSVPREQRRQKPICWQRSKLLATDVGTEAVRCRREAVLGARRRLIWGNVSTKDLLVDFKEHNFWGGTALYQFHEFPKNMEECLGFLFAIIEFSDWNSSLSKISIINCSGAVFDLCINE